MEESKLNYLIQFSECHDYPTSFLLGVPLQPSCPLVIRPGSPKVGAFLRGIDLSGNLPTPTNLHVFPLVSLFVLDLLEVDLLAGCHHDPMDLLTGVRILTRLLIDVSVRPNAGVSLPTQLARNLTLEHSFYTVT